MEEKCLSRVTNGDPTDSLRLRLRLNQFSNYSLFFYSHSIVTVNEFRSNRQLLSSLFNLLGASSQLRCSTTLKIDHRLSIVLLLEIYFLFQDQVYARFVFSFDPICFAIFLILYFLLFTIFEGLDLDFDQMRIGLADSELVMVN